jgi:DNA-binding transcriptional LysR family regulator
MQTEFLSQILQRASIWRVSKTNDSDFDVATSRAQRWRKTVLGLDWLPAFYVVAQTQHLPTASKRLHVSMSALSRTIRLLEDMLGRSLFRRVGRNLELNAHGQGWLAALENSVGALTSEFNRLTAAGLRGALRIAVVAPLSQTAIVAPLLETLPYLQSSRDHEEASRLLLAGDLNLVLSCDPKSEPSVSVELIAQLTHGIFCGRAHSLFQINALSAEVVLRHPFVACVSPRQVWPTTVQRKIAIYVNQEDTALQRVSRVSF